MQSEEPIQNLAWRSPAEVADIYEARMREVLAENERLRGERDDARNYAAEIAHGVTHYPHTDLDPCIRCENERLARIEAKIKEMREAADEVEQTLRGGDDEGK